MKHSCVGNIPYNRFEQRCICGICNKTITTLTCWNMSETPIIIVDNTQISSCSVLQQLKNDINDLILELKACDIIRSSCNSIISPISMTFGFYWMLWISELDEFDISNNLCLYIFLFLQIYWGCHLDWLWNVCG